MAKQLKVKVDGASWYLSEAELQLTDVVKYECNYVYFYIVMRRAGGEYDYSGDRCNLIIKLQRSPVAAEADDRADGYMDTRRGWGHSYGARVDVETDIELFDVPFNLCLSDRVKHAVMRKLAREITRANLWRFEACQARQIVMALQRYDVHVKKVYGDHRTEIHMVEGLGYHRRAREARYEAERAACEAEQAADATA